MRRLAQPAVLESAAVAAFGTALLCFPRLALWTHRRDPLWYLVAILFLGTTLLWGGVFAWHHRYSQCPVFAARPDPRLWGLATLMGIGVVSLLHLFVDPSLRLLNPEDYPVNAGQWAAATLFQMAFTPLFLVFAPFAWAIRLFQDRRAAVVTTILFGVVVLALKTRSSDVPLPTALLAALLALRIVFGLLTVTWYLKGGAPLVWWWYLLVEARHWWKSAGNPGIGD